MSLVRAGQAVLIAAVSFAGLFTGTSAEAVTTGSQQVHAKFIASLVARHSGKCLDVYNGSMADGANVQQWVCGNGQANQEWRFKDAGNGYYTLRARHSHKCLDVYNGSMADGANVQQWICGKGQANQEWRLDQKDNGYFTVVNRNSGKCLDVYNGDIADGANVQQWPCLGANPNQEWKLA
jgi:hypothetical protein